jgi:uncharacterized membrane protein YoaK (UPF0700 family)
MAKTIIFNVKGNSITRQMTEAQIKNLGGNLFLRKKAKYWLSLVVLGLIWGVIGSFMFRRGIDTNIIIVLPMVVVIVAFIYSFRKAGRNFWNRIKDLPEPVEIK